MLFRIDFKLYSVWSECEKKATDIQTDKQLKWERDGKGYMHTYKSALNNSADKHFYLFNRKFLQFAFAIEILNL